MLALAAALATRRRQLAPEPDHTETWTPVDLTK